MRALEALLLAAGVERRAEGGALLAPLHAALRPALNYSSGARLTALTPHLNPHPNPNPDPNPHLNRDPNPNPNSNQGAAKLAEREAGGEDHDEIKSSFLMAGK